MGDYLIELKRDIIPPTAFGTRIAPRAVLIDASERVGVETISERIIANTPIAFQLDAPGGLSECENDDNWGAGPLGYDVRRLASAGATGAGVRVGIADSGIDAAHPAFVSLIRDKRLSSFAAFDSNGVKLVQHDAGGLLVADTEASPSFTHWHGTFCAACLVGEETQGRLRGIAPRADLAVARVLQNFNNGTVASIYAGIAWLADQRCDVVSLSLGWEGKHGDWAVPIQALIDDGVVVVAAAGNSFGIPGVPPSDSPANYPIADPGSPKGLLISVGTIDASGNVGDRSGAETASWADEADVTATVFAGAAAVEVPLLVAPGVGIVSAAPGGGYRQETGTSMAAPQVAGLIAVTLQRLRAADPKATARHAAELVFAALKPLSLDVNVPRSGNGKVDLDVLLASLPAAQ